MDTHQLKTRPVVVRRELFDYNELGLNEKDLVILIKLIYAAEVSNKQPSIEFCKRFKYGAERNNINYSKFNS